MKKRQPAGSQDAYVSALSGCHRVGVDSLRRATLAAGTLEERIKWGHLAYCSNGPVLLMRAEEKRVLSGFWRGNRLRGLAERLKPGGKYELATMVLVEGDKINPTRLRTLVKAAIELNYSVGDPRATSSAGQE